jgi:hypothetical protein
LPERDERLPEVVHGRAPLRAIEATALDLLIQTTLCACRVNAVAR